jgi:serine/threonine protein kinase
MMAIVNNPHDPISHDLYSDELKDIINKLLTKDPEQRPSIQELTEVPIIKNALDMLIKEFEGKIFFELRSSLIKISLINLPASKWISSFVLVWGDRLYTAADKTLHVYSLSDLTSPIATYPLGGNCDSALITENRLYLGGWCNLHIFEVTPSLTEPLTPVTQIPTKTYVTKILRVGDDLLLG